ncbi:hypothetical protein [Aetokthonos hydrillicola]|uniref:hypothetical protein n=1 Tax=Aetokthonos hydrillicola TaxID=1550245 RepID=UPI001ABBCCEB|nr:hypothetical protein [Aetokthonos hydrillicola]MBO3459868.1 hypothetical protein [Aetokthonos hydrillicola CCALA 1050]MBW4583984.1 hypothetical protein [Aetokthonos hydrillicola CCALA 1050]
MTKKRIIESNNSQIPDSDTSKKPKDLASFNLFQLDEKTKKNLKGYPKTGGEPDNLLSSYLPSPGVVFPPKFLKSLEDDKEIKYGNFYVPMRTLLHSRKISQLIAKTWWSYMEARKTEENSECWKNFVDGKWGLIDSEILDGLIAREIFLFGGGDVPDKIEKPDNPDVYWPSRPEERCKNTRFIIFPGSKAWQGSCLSLLLAGQAYYDSYESTGKYSYERKRTGKYHQISQPILSTGEITDQYTLEVDWCSFNANIKEILISQEKPWVAYQVAIPYPPIPKEATEKEVREWAYAKEDPEKAEKDPEKGGNFPFFIRDTSGKYVADVKYFRSPYPYIPLSSS